jgi:mannose-6-phosphate isomerase
VPSYPLLFEPILKPKVWGGRRLVGLGKRMPPDGTIGESWEIADLPADIADGRSRVINGRLAGRTLHDLMRDNPARVLGPRHLDRRTSWGGFPLLVKFLDARENLSVQVHPDERFARMHPGSHLKSEAWVVIAAEPGSMIYAGVRDGVSPEVFARATRTGDVADLLRAVPANVGDCLYLPSGTCHALGAGVLVAEIQTPSDTTFRVYDWGRTDRELHIEAALECIDFSLQPAVETGREAISADGFITTPLCACEHFEIERIEAASGESLPIVTRGGPVVWIVASGRGVIETIEAESVAFSAGTTILHPAMINHAEARFDEPTEVLRVTLPSPLRGMIA